MNNSQFILTFPEGWKENTVYTFEGPNDSGVQHNLVLTMVPVLDKDLDVTRFAKECIRDAQNVLPGFELINESEGKLPTGEKVAIIVYKYFPAENLTCYQKQYYIIINQKAYIFSSTFSKKTLQTISKQVDSIVMSLKVRG